jgi:hypothetical protein
MRNFGVRFKRVPLMYDNTFASVCDGWVSVIRRSLL